jgi:hypothetical protein
MKRPDILRYMFDSTLRERVQLQLNHVESRHELAWRLFFDNQGAFPSGDHEGITNKVSTLSVWSNAVVVWNTARDALIIYGLRSASGKSMEPKDFERISPSVHSHVTPSGG